MVFCENEPGPEASDPSWKPEICVNPPEAEADVTAPSWAIVSLNCERVKPPVVIVPPSSSAVSCAVVYPARTQAPAVALGAIARVVAGLKLPLTESWKLTEH